MSRKVYVMISDWSKYLWKSPLWPRIDQNVYKNLHCSLELIKMSKKNKKKQQHCSLKLIKISVSISVMVSDWSKYQGKSPLLSRIAQNIWDNLRYGLGLLKNICENLRYCLGFIKISVKISVIVSDSSKISGTISAMVSDSSKYQGKSPLWSRIALNIRGNLRYGLGMLKISGK